MRFVRSSRLVRPGSRPLRSRPGILIGGGASAGLQLVDMLLVEVANTTPLTYSFAAMGPAAGDLMVINSRQGNGVAGAGGTSSSGWTEVTTIDSTGRLMYKTLAGGETSITFDADPSYRNVTFALFRGGQISGTPKFQQANSFTTVTTTATTFPSTSVPVGSMRFCALTGGSSTWTGAPGTFSGTPLDSAGLYIATGFKGSAMSAVYAGTGSAEAPVFTYGATTFSFNYTTALAACDVIIAPL